MRAHDHGIGLEQGDVIGVRHREWMVRRDEMPLVVGALEERELGDPHKTERPLADGRLTQVEAQLAQHLARAFPLAGDDKHEVAWFGSGCIHNLALMSLGEELGDRRFQHALGAHSHPHQAGSPELNCALDKPVETAPGPLPRARPRHANGPHTGRLEGVELRARDGLA